MTTKELLNKYGVHSYKKCDVLNKYGMQVCNCDGKQRIKELEASIRKEVILSLLERLSVLDVREPLPKHLTALDIHGWAKENGITLN